MQDTDSEVKRLNALVSRLPHTMHISVSKDGAWLACRGLGGRGLGPAVTECSTHVQVGDINKWRERDLERLQEVQAQLEAKAAETGNLHRSVEIATVRRRPGNNVHGACLCLHKLHYRCLLRLCR